MVTTRGWKADEQTFRELLEAFRRSCEACCAAKYRDDVALCPTHQETLGSQRFIDRMLWMRAEREHLIEIDGTPTGRERRRS